ncbi:catenin alpha-2-like [Leptonychotes weddellii]|uniref:Catenin alpha-2-like n=1 Tax=Leptonychotes weddellii TaxID=9713 RepID=A0A7F8Q9P6_LEPWE|nr:catenin alpha-2-like [Leptonychotes weddellii]
MTFSEARFRPSLEERLESIISGAALMADSSCTRDDRRERIVAECNAVRQALQDLLSEYMNNFPSPAPASLSIIPLSECMNHLHWTS